MRGARAGLRHALRSQNGAVAKLVLVWLVIVAGLYWFFFVWLERQHNPNTQHVLLAQPAGEVILQRNRAGHYLADGAINGEPVVFLLDTGATQVSLSVELARRIGLRLGAIEMRDVAALATEGMEPGMVLLGMNFLKRLEMTQRGDRLILRAPDPKR